MNVAELAKILGAEFKATGDVSRVVSGGYAGDFLSFVMGRAPEDSAWLTVMSNINVAAVAILAEVSVIVLCEGVKAETPLIARCKEKNINLLETALDIFSAAREYINNGG
ncbi:MAG: hypothetical protein WC292_02310 [Clostridia bacterium]